MESNFVTYEQALALKELGFDEPCFGVFINGNFNLIFSQHQLDGISLAPLKSQVFKFFREKYELYYTIRPVRGSKKYGFVFSIYSENDDINETYEEAENGAIDKLIEIVKNNS